MLVMAIDRVLRDPNTEEVIPHGRILYEGLTGVRGVALLSDNPVSDAKWLKSHGLTEHNFLVENLDGTVGPNDDLTDDLKVYQSRLNQLRRARTRGSVELVIEGAPDLAAATLRAGYPVMLVTEPSYRAPDHHPGAKRVPAPWHEVMSEVERQREAKAQDDRLDWSRVY